MSKVFAPNFPFHPKNCPIFYGWIILFCAICTRIISIPGYTVGICPFIEPLIKNLGISRNSLSNIFLFATLSSTLILPSLGKIFDRVGVRKSITYSSLFFGISIYFLGNIPVLVRCLSSFLTNSTATITALLLGIFLLKLFGQGSIPLASRMMLLHWYDKKSCTMLGITGVFISAIFGVAPKIIDMLVKKYGYLQTWTIMAFIILTTFVPLIWAICRDNPQQVGLELDGQASKNSDELCTSSSKTLDQAVRTFDFWIFVIAASNTIFLTTGLQIHIVDIFREAQADTNYAMGIFIPISIFSAIGGILSILQDKISIKYCLIAIFLTHFLLLISIEWLGSSIGLGIFAILFGGTWALHGIVFSAPWPKLFGRKHLGHIMSTVSLISAIFSSIAPSVMSYTKHYGGSYFLATRTVAVLSLIYLAVSVIYIIKTRKKL